jgi:CSLREA domain-containing protein
MSPRTLLIGALSISCAAPAAFAATFTVNTTVDAPDASPGNGVCLTASGTCSLRAAIEEANVTAATDTIAFAIPGAGVHRIITSTLPSASRPLIVDGFTQPGSQPNTNPTGGLNAVLTIELAGGLKLLGGTSTARGLVVNSGPVRFGLALAGPNVVEGCYIGTDPTGTQIPLRDDGIRIENTGGPARVGGTLPAQRNLISGNYTGVSVGCPLANINYPCNPGTVIQGNLIGTTVTGTSALGNLTGVDSVSSGEITIGGSGSGRNVISGNTVVGIGFGGNVATGVVRIQGNRIGVDDSGTIAIPNQSGVVGIFGCVGSSCANLGPAIVDIGGSPATANLIARNTYEGIWMRPGQAFITYNSIVRNGTQGVLLETPVAKAVTGSVTDNTITDNRWAGIEVNAVAAPVTVDILRNVIRTNLRDGVTLNGAVRARLAGNAISNNVRLGIDLGGNGVTANDPLDLDTGPNDQMNYPVLTPACSTNGVVTVTGSLNTRPGTAATIELFRSPSCDPSGNGEGEVLQAAQSVTTNGSGDAAFAFTYAGANGDFITATATSAAGETSEFSRCVPVAPITPPPQAISGPPAACAGTAFRLQANAGAAGYQWFLDGVPIAGAVGEIYARPAAAITDGGNYTVVASGCGMNATSPPFAFSVVNCAVLPVRLDVDARGAAGTSSDLNRVLEAGESVLVEPRYQNVTATAMALAGTATLAGAAPGTYTLPDASASYGSVASGQVTDCFGATGDCYRATVTGPRPQAHWDATFVETVSGSTDPPRYWPMHIGETFTDVPRANNFYRFVETLVHDGVTSGCSGSTYCPSAPTSRQQLAVFVLVAREGVGYAPPACDPAAPRFADVPASNPFCRWIEELARRGVVSGCGANAYCPLTNVPRNQMAVFVLATREAPGYTPPACVAGAEVFNDVPASSAFCRWIEELARRGVVGGCSAGSYCPAAPVSRGEMSVFIVATFGLLLYGP